VTEDGESFPGPTDLNQVGGQGGALKGFLKGWLESGVSYCGTKVMRGLLDLSGMGKRERWYSRPDRRRGGNPEKETRYTHEGNNCWDGKSERKAGERGGEQYETKNINHKNVPSHGLARGTGV